MTAPKTLGLPRHSSYRRPVTKRATNLTLLPAVVVQAASIAGERYKISVSELVDRLLIREINSKNGMAHEEQLK